MDTVRCGFANRDRNLLIWIPTVASFIHPNYNVTNFNHNIAVLRLQANSLLSSNFIFPISMADNKIIQSEFTQGLIYGFGFTTNNGDFATTLQQGFQLIQQEWSCISQQHFPHLAARFNNSFCARAVGN